MAPRISLAIVLALSPLTAVAKMIQKQIPYQVAGDKFEGVLIYDDTATSKPGVFMVPNWFGINEANLKQARLVAARGYVVFVADTYGIGKRPTNAGEAGKASGALKDDRAALRARMRAGYNAFLADKVARTDKVGAIGFCFGGTAALELARSGAKLGAIVTFHAGLSSPTPADAKNITGPVLVLHGADDPYVPPAEVAAFEKEMRDAKRDWQLVLFGNAVHSFTDVDAKDPTATMYNPVVAARAYQMMDLFFNENLR